MENKLRGVCNKAPFSFIFELSETMFWRGDIYESNTNTRFESDLVSMEPCKPDIFMQTYEALE